MLMGRDQMAVLHSFFLKELCKILQLHLATQKDTNVLRFLLKYRYFLPLKTRSKEEGVFVKLIPVCFSLDQLLLHPPRQRGKGQGMRMGMRTFGVFPVPSAVTFGLECKANQSPWRGSPGATTAPRGPRGVTSRNSWLTVRHRECHQTPATHRQAHQAGPKEWKNDHRKPQKIAICCTMSGRHSLGKGHNFCLSSVSTEQVGNGTFTVQMAESAAFLALPMYTQAQNAGKYLILVFLCRRFFTENTPGPARQSVQTHLYQRVTQVHSLSTGNYTPPVQKELINASGGGDCCLFCFLSPTYPSCRMPVVKSSQHFKPAVRALKEWR